MLATPRVTFFKVIIPFSFAYFSQSANIMIKMLIERGMPEAMANKLPSQIRKGAAMHDAWKDAFASGRFVQKLGRTNTTTQVHAQANVPVYPYQTGQPVFKKARTAAPVQSREESPPPVPVSLKFTAYHLFFSMIDGLFY